MEVSDSSSFSDNEGEHDIVSEEIRKEAEKAIFKSMNVDSKKLYVMAYNSFKKWRKENGSNSFCQDVLLAYFSQLSSKYASSTLWSIYSKLRCTIENFDNVDISKYGKLKAFLKRNNKGHIPKKSAVFTKDNISKFLSQAPNEVYLIEKVALIFGIAGAMRRIEFVEMTNDQIRNLEDEVLLVCIPKTKNYKPRSFTITGVLYDICKKYIKARSDITLNRFFIRHNAGKFYNQAIGINAFGLMPNKIATYLGLPNSKSFTGHSFRRTSATLLADAGADLLDLKRHGGWESDKVAAGYIAESMANKKKLYNMITGGIKVDDTKISDNQANSASKLNATVTDIVVNPLQLIQDAEIIVNQSENIPDVYPITVIAECNQERRSVIPSTSQQTTNLVRHTAVETNSTSKNYVAANVTASTSEQTYLVPVELTGNINKSIAIKTKSISATATASIDSSNNNYRTQEAQLPDKLPVFYDPQVGLYIQDFKNNSFIFENSNVTINDSQYGSFIFHNCNVTYNNIGKLESDKKSG